MSLGLETVVGGGGRARNPNQLQGNSGARLAHPCAQGQGQQVSTPLPPSVIGYVVPWNGRPWTRLSLQLRQPMEGLMAEGCMPVSQQLQQQAFLREGAGQYTTCCTLPVWTVKSSREHHASHLVLPPWYHVYCAHSVCVSHGHGMSK